MRLVGTQAREEHLIDRLVENIERGRFERMLSAITAFGALMVCAEVYYEHYKGSFGNKFMWTPVVATPPLLAASVAAVFSRAAAKTFLPAAAGGYAAVGAIGLFFHARGIVRKPGGLKYAWYNITMGPPPMAPALFAMVGGMGILAALLRREK
ncbi:MAG TPA: hypothetical protein VN697_06890 [Tepidiformaceae bacterium]|nr:hypothetical protein [Tepidiformaceae bacterium]